MSCLFSGWSQRKARVRCFEGCHCSLHAGEVSRLRRILTLESKNLNFKQSLQNILKAISKNRVQTQWRSSPSQIYNFGVRCCFTETHEPGLKNKQCRPLLKQSLYRSTNTVTKIFIRN